MYIQKVLHRDLTEMTIRIDMREKDSDSLSKQYHKVLGDCGFAQRESKNKIRGLIVGQKRRFIFL